MSSLTIPHVIDAVNLAQPLPDLEMALYAWAASLGYGSVYTRAQFERIRAELATRAAAGEAGIRQVLSEFHLGAGALTAIERHPAAGWGAYVASFEQERLLGRVQMFRALERRLGGILFNGFQNPVVLVLPQPDGSWIKIGWDSLTLHGSSPLRARDQAPPPIRTHGADTVPANATADLMSLVP
jgi:hypothetical protein